MPYLKTEQKIYFDDLLVRLKRHSISTSGELNFLITELVKQFLKDGYNYEKLNAVVGALECAKTEFQRRIVGPYENLKISINGDVYEDFSDAK